MISFRFHDSCPSTRVMFEDGKTGVVRLKDLSIACSCPTPANAVNLPSYAPTRESFRASISGADDNVDETRNWDAITAKCGPSGASRERLPAAWHKSTLMRVRRKITKGMGTLLASSRVLSNDNSTSKAPRFI